METEKITGKENFETKDPGEDTGSEIGLVAVIAIVIGILLLLGLMFLGFWFYRSTKRESVLIPPAEETPSEDTEDPVVCHECEEADTEMAALWPEYTDEEWDYSLKHPADLDASRSDGDEVDVVGYSPDGRGVENLAFLTWVWTTDDLNATMERILMPECNDGVSFETVRYGDYEYTKATAINQRWACMSMMSLAEDQDFVAFGREIEEGTYFILRNDGLTEEQLDVVMCELAF